MKKKSKILTEFSKDLMNVENIVYDVCAKEITKAQAMIDIMKLI